MHLEHNLDLDNSIVDQLHDFGVAVYHMNPEDEDFRYKYMDLSQEHKDCIWGMAYAIDSLGSFESNRKEDWELERVSSTISKIENEIACDTLTKAIEWLVIEMCEALISFADDEYCTNETGE